MTEEKKKPEELNEEAKAEETAAAPEAPKEEAKEEAKPEAPKEEAKTEATPEAKTEEKKEEVKVVADGKPRAPSKPEPKEGEAQEEGCRGRGPRGKGGGKGKKKTRRKRNDADEQVEFTEKVVQVRRVTKVVKGGKKLSFRAAVIIGNEKGKVGVGVGKASEVLIAIKKAVSDARKNLVDVPSVGSTISHNVIGISSGAKVLLKPAADGTGIIAGGTARIVLELAGLGDILSKSQGSRSPLNVARATVNALKSLRSFQEVASLRGLTVKQMLF